MEPMKPLKMYEIKFKKTPRSAVTMAWIRFYQDINRAKEDAPKAVQYAYPKGVVVQVEEMKRGGLWAGPKT